MNLSPKTTWQTLLLTVTALVLFTGCRVSVKEEETIKTVAVTPEEQAQAVESLKAFLAEIDKDDGQSWEQMAQVLKASVSQATWSTTVAAMKLATGKSLERGSAQGACTENLPDSPPGRYFIFDIPTKFERMELTERVVLLWEDGQWKVAGYFRKKSITFGSESTKA